MIGESALELISYHLIFVKKACKATKKQTLFIIFYSKNHSEIGI